MKTLSVTETKSVSGGIVINPITVALAKVAVGYAAKKAAKYYAKKVAIGAVTGATAGATKALLEK